MPDPKLEVKRTRKVESKETEPKKSEAVSAGTIEKALDLAFNPSREKLREVTIIDRLQGRLLPLLDLVNLGQQYILEIAHYRADSVAYRTIFEKDKPISPNFLDDLMYRIAQWQKSVAGTNLTKITDIALAEMEIRGEEEPDKYGITDPYLKE